MPAYLITKLQGRRGSGGIAPSFLCSELDEVISFTLWALCPRTHWIRGSREPQRRFGRCGEDIILPLLGIKPRSSNPHGPSRHQPSYTTRCVLNCDLKFCPMSSLTFHNGLHTAKRAETDPGSYVGFVVDNVALAERFLRVLRVPTRHQHQLQVH